MIDASNAIATLESFRLRKGMYISPVTAEAAYGFLSGFFVACAACGLVDGWIQWSNSVKSRGWNCGTDNPIQKMREAGLAEDAIVDELIAICITAISGPNAGLPENRISN